MKTLGEKRVRVDFNVESDGNIDIIKKRGAENIDFCETMKGLNPAGEKTRLLALAQTAFEEATMWAVKGLTYKE